LPKGISKEDVQEYYVVESSKFNTRREIFERFVISAQNYQRMPNVIGYVKDKPEGRKADVDEVLHNLDIDYVKELEPEKLYREFRERFHITTTDSKHNSWYKCLTYVLNSIKVPKLSRIEPCNNTHNLCLISSDFVNLLKEIRVL